ncbi:MAG: hypothetical protein LJE84_12385 [Gammaproteobacteria bacterium]|nr:hypothetical protein [Gammaproteobacteria bacterium]
MATLPAAGFFAVVLRAGLRFEDAARPFLATLPAAGFFVAVLRAVLRFFVAAVFLPAVVEVLVLRTVALVFALLREAAPAVLDRVVRFPGVFLEGVFRSLLVARVLEAAADGLRTARDLDSGIFLQWVGVAKGPPDLIVVYNRAT